MTPQKKATDARIDFVAPAEFKAKLQGLADRHYLKLGPFIRLIVSAYFRDGWPLIAKDEKERD